MVKNGNNTVDEKILAGLLQELLGRALPAPALSLIRDRTRRTEWAHSLDFPAGGGFFIIGRGDVNGFVCTVTDAGWGHPELISTLGPGDSFYLPPIETAYNRNLTYEPVSAAEIYYLEWTGLADLLRTENGTAPVIRELLDGAQARLARGLASAAVHLPDDWSGTVPELPVPGGRPDYRESDFSGIAPVSLAAGKSWSDETAAGVFIARGRVGLAEGNGGKVFSARGPGLQATGGTLVLKAESETVLYPVPRSKLRDGTLIPKGDSRLLILDLASSLTDPGGSLAAILEQADQEGFENYLAGIRSSEKAARAAAAAKLASIQEHHRTMPFIPAAGPEAAWAAAVKMVARYEGQKQLQQGEIKPEPGGSRKQDPVSSRAKSYGMFSRRITIRPGTLRRISSPIIAVQKNRTPLVLEPDRGRLWAHDPLKGSYRVAPGDLEEELTGRAYELIPDLPPGPIGPKRFLGLAFAHLGASIRRLIGASLVVTFFGMFTPVATGWIFGQAIPSSQADLLTAIGLALMAAAAAAALFSMFRSMIEINFEALADTRLASMLMSRLLRLPVSFFRRYSIGDLSMRFRAVLEIRQLLTSAVLSVGLNGIFSLFYLFLMFKYSAQLAWYGLGLGGAVAAIMIAIFRVVTGMQRSMLARRAKEQSILYELINGILVVRSSGAGRRLYNRWLNSFGSEMKMYYKSSRAQMWSPILYGGLPILGTLLMFLFGGKNILSGKLPLSSFIAYNSAFAVFFLGIIGACRTAVTLTLIRPLWERAKPLIDAEEENSGRKVEPGALSGRIELRDCSFRYRDEEPLVLRDLSLAVAPGEFVAVTGPSGAGKSTLIRLLIGFETPNRGAIFYDNYDLRELDLSRVRRQIGVVLQENQLVPGSITTNLRVNAPLASMDDIVTAAREADIHRDIMAMPMRYETFVSEGGTTFSGGQCQRLAIARALVPRPKILFFDEATSSLDNVSQEKVEESLDKLKATRIVVAHRLSTIRKADRIVVLDQGRIAQEGTYAELMKKQGLFRELVERQQL